MIKTGDGEHPHSIQQDRHDYGDRTPSDNNNGEDREMEGYKRDRAHPIHLPTVTIWRTT